MGKHYPKLGGTLKQVCEGLADGLDKNGAVIVLYRGTREQAEVEMCFRSDFKADAKLFCDFAEAVLRCHDCHGLDKSNAHLIRLAEATDAECAMLFLISHDEIKVSVSRPKSNEFVAQHVLAIANGLNARN